MSDAPDVTDQPIPDWDDEYLDRVADTLQFNYDLERDRRVDGETFDLYGRLRIESQKQLVHPSINFANHQMEEHLFARRTDRVTRSILDQLVTFGHDLADRWIEADEEHYGTDFTFVLIAPEIADDVRSFVSGFSDRTLLKYGYYGRYEINLVVVAPDDEDIVASENADIARAFALWGDVPSLQESGLLTRVLRRLVH